MTSSYLTDPCESSYEGDTELLLSLRVRWVVALYTDDFSSSPDARGTLYMVFEQLD